MAGQLETISTSQKGANDRSSILEYMESNNGSGTTGSHASVEVTAGPYFETDTETTTVRLAENDMQRLEMHRFAFLTCKVKQDGEESSGSQIMKRQHVCCARSFFFIRKHHCRHCGAVVAFVLGIAP